MFFTHVLSFSAAATLFSLAIARPNSTCYSYGVDFVDGESYFINTLSHNPFTCVSAFEGCNPSTADVLLVDPNGYEQFCSDLDTTPKGAPALSTCPILKSQMISGDWIVLVLGNNGDGIPFAWQRDLYLDCGPQATTTITQTATFSITTTPIVTSTSTVIITLSLSPTTTYTVATATRVEVITPKTTTTLTKAYTRVLTSWTESLVITIKTITARCILPPEGRPDKPCTYHPTLMHAAALEMPTNSPKFQRYSRKADHAVDIEYARSRIEAAKARRDHKAAPLGGRAADAPTSTITAPTPVNATVILTASAVLEIVFTTSTTSTQLPDVTLYSGIWTSATTLAPIIKTRYSILYSTAYTTKTIRATWTLTTTTTPRATETACQKLGGHIGSGRV